MTPARDTPVAARHADGSRRGRSSGRHHGAWPGLFLAPIAFSLDLGIAYALVPWACAHQQHVAVHATEIVFLAIALFGTWHGWRLWRAHRGAHGSDAGDRASQEQFLGIVGTLGSALFTLAIVAQWFTAFVVPACLS